MNKLILGAAAVISSCIMCLPVSAEEISFNDLRVDPISSMQHLWSVHLSENENTIQLVCDDIGNAYDEFYLSIYRHTTEETSGYVVKYFGPIDITNFKISGLQGNEDYKIRLSSADGRRRIIGKIITSFEEVPQ